jgi:CBS domain-containing protein
MKVKDLCTRDVHTCGRSASLAEAGQILRTAACDLIAVVDDDGGLLGVLTDRDVCVAAASRPVPLAAIPVGEIMTGPPHTCSLEKDLLLAMEEMGRHRVKQLPVVDRNGRLQGILSLADVVRTARARTVALLGQPTFEDLARLMRSLCGSRRRRADRRRTPVDPFMA